MEKKSRRSETTTYDKEERPEKVFRKKRCRFCIERLGAIDYKDTARIKKNLTERGKIIPRRITGNCSYHQRQMASAVKRARYIALIPFIIDY